jgi:hypothetical protein
LVEITKAVESLKQENVVIGDVKGKGKSKTSDVFHHVCLFYFLFYFICFLVFVLI